MNRFYLLAISLLLLLSLFLLTLAPVHGQDQLGTVTKVSQPACTGVNPGSACYALTVECPEIVTSSVRLKVFAAENPVGLVMLGTGGLGGGWFDSDTYGMVTIDDLLAANFSVAEVAFVGGWEANTNGTGLRKGACRYATAANWVRANLTPSQPFCVSGNSGGAAVIGYGLAHYDLDLILNFALLSSGPPFSRVDWACDNSQPETMEYCTNEMAGMGVGMGNAEEFIDPAYAPTLTAACSSSYKHRSKAMDYIFLPDSINSQDAKLSYAITVEFMYGGQNFEGTPINQGEYYRSSIQSPTTRSCIADAPHTIPDVQDGAQAIAADLIANCH